MSGGVARKRFYRGQRCRDVFFVLETLGVASARERGSEGRGSLSWCTRLQVKLSLHFVRLF